MEPTQPPVHNSGRGAQYLSIRYAEQLAEASIEPSVARIGNSYDNALTETIIVLYKTKVIRRRGPWRHLEAAALATLKWVEWFNHHRLFKPIGDLTPIEKEEIYIQNQEWTKVP